MGNETVSWGGLNVNIRGSKHEFCKKHRHRVKNIVVSLFAVYKISV